MSGRWDIRTHQWFALQAWCAVDVVLHWSMGTEHIGSWLETVNI